MQRVLYALMAAALACGTATPSARAQQTTTDGLQFYITPYLWIAGVSGTLETPLPRIPSLDASANFGDILSHLDAIPIMGAAEVRYGRFGLLTDVIAISVKAGVSTNNVLFSGGNTKLTQFIGTIAPVYRVLEASDQSLDLGAGVRVFGMWAKFGLYSGLLPGFTISPSASWATGLAVARYHYQINSKWGLTAYGDIGAGPSSDLTWQLLGTVDYQLTASTVVRLGYRHLQFQFGGNILNQNMRMSGPILATTIRF